MGNERMIANRVKRPVSEFFRIKTCREDFGYLPAISALPPVREVFVSTARIGGRKFARFDYGQVRGARPGV